jgi:hypothetical protein
VSNNSTGLLANKNKAEIEEYKKLTFNADFTASK